MIEKINGIVSNYSILNLKSIILKMKAVNY